MIIYKEGDILQDDADVLVNPVNCHGVMGKGLSLQFKAAYPNYYEEYRKDCKAGLYRPGFVRLNAMDETGQSNRQICSFATKDHWSADSQLTWIEQGFGTMNILFSYRIIRSIAIPKVGCGLGGLNWDDVKLIVEQFAASNPFIEVRVYE